MTPAIAAFYGEPRLFGITTVLALGFLFNAAGTQEHNTQRFFNAK